jgi:hydrogenase maturation protease
LEVDELDKLYKVLVLGLGNKLMGDEAAGIEVINYLENNGVANEVCYLDGGTGTFDLLDPMKRAKNIILVDASINNDSKPGTITRLVPKFSADYPISLSGHELGLKDLLNAFYLCGGSDERVILYAISINLPDDLKIGLSPEIEQVIPIVAKKISDEVNSYL